MGPGCRRDAQHTFTRRLINPVLSMMCGAYGQADPGGYRPLPARGKRSDVAAPSASMIWQPDLAVRVGMPISSLLCAASASWVDSSRATVCGECGADASSVHFAGPQMSGDDTVGVLQPGCQLVTFGGGE